MNSLIGLASGVMSNGVVLASAQNASKDRLIGFDVQTLAQVAFHAVAILVLIFVLAKLLFNPVREILRKRQEGIANEFKSIKTQKEETAALKAEYESKLKNIQQEADDILKEAHKKALNREKYIINEANAEAERILNRGKLEVQREQEKAKDEIKKQIVDIATVMASKFVMQSIDANTQDQLIEQTISEMGDNAWLD